MICPCCGQPVSEEIQSQTRVFFGPVQARIVNLLRRNKDGLTTEQLQDRIYSDSISKSTIGVTIHNINRKLKPIGLKIKASGGRGSIYQLIKES